MRKIVLFSPTGYVGGFLKERMLGENDIQLFEISRNTKLDEMRDAYDIMVYSASVSRSDAKGYISDNVMTAISMMDFCKEHHIKRVIYLSSDSIYGRLDADEASENAVMINPDFYGTTKYLAEKIIMESGIPYYILRMPGIVGKTWRDTYLYRLIDRLSRNEIVSVCNGDKNFNNVLDIEDLINFIMRLCNLQEESSEIFLLGNTEKIELQKIIDYAKERCQSESEIRLSDAKGRRYFTLDVSKAAEYGYSSKSIWRIIDEIYEMKKKRLQEDKNEGNYTRRRHDRMRGGKRT